MSSKRGTYQIYYAANFCRASDIPFQYTDTGLKNVKKKISSKIIQPTGFWMVSMTNVFMLQVSEPYLFLKDKFATASGFHSVR